MRFSLLVAFLSIAVASTAVTAQPRVGDVVFSTAGTTVAGLYNISRNGQVMGTLISGAIAPSFPNWVEMWDDNKDMAICVTMSQGSTPSGFWRVDPIGTPTTIASPIPSSPNHIAPAEDGLSYFVSGAQINAVYDIPRGGPGFTTIITVTPGFSNCLTIDADTGEFIVGGSSSYPAPPTPPTPGTGFLLRYDTNFQLQATIATSLLRVSGVTSDLQQGGFFVSRFDQGGILHVTRNGLVTTILATNTRNNSVLLDADGTLWTVDVADITHFDRQGVVINKFTVPLNSPGLTGMTIYGHRVLVPSGPLAPGTPLTITIASQRSTEANKPYAMAASFSTRPGFRIAGNWVNLAVDPLFLLTSGNVLPQVFKNFTGTLSLIGTAQATVQLPPGFPPNTGIRLHMQAVILDPLAPGGISSVTNTMHLTVQ